MSKLGIGTGITPDDGNGDSLLEGAVKVNSNFNEIYSYFGDGTDLTSGSWQKVTSGINTTLNVGIGTTNAESKLTVSGDVSITGVTTITGNYFYVGNPDITSDLTSGVVLDTSGKITHQSVGGETHIVGYAGSSLSYALSKDGNLYLGGGNPDDGGTGGNITILGETGRIGIGSTLPPSALTVVGTTSLETLNVSGVSTFSGNISVAGTVTADTMIFTNNGGSSLNGSLTINNVSASYTELFFRDSSGSVQSNIQGGTNLSLNPGGGGYISLGTYSYFYPNGDVVLNNGNQGTTLIRNQVHVQSGITSFYNNVSVGGTISVDGGVTVTGTTFTNQLSVSGVSTFSNDVKVTGITSTRDLIIYGNGNESGSISTVALMSRNNYIDFGPAIENTSAVQQFALRLGSDRAPNTFGVYNILGASWTNPSGSVFLNNWNGTAAIGINDDVVSITARPLTVGTGTSTGTASQTLQVTGGAYVSDSVGIGTTIATEKLTVRGGDISVGVSTSHGVVLTSPNGTQYRLIVDDSGNLSTTAV